MAILSVPEEDEEPLKYPRIFQKADALVVKKMDALEIFDFDVEAFRRRVCI